MDGERIFSSSLICNISFLMFGFNVSMSRFYFLCNSMRRTR